MNYIYDILINFQSNLYDIYEWNKNDDIYHIRKIPMFRVTTKALKDLCHYEIEISNEMLTKIYNRTELFQRNKVTSLAYCFLATDLNEVVSFQFNSNGSIIGYSKLLLEEEAEVLEYARGLGIVPLTYKVLKPKEDISLQTREEVKIRKFIVKELKQMIKKQDDDKLFYLYLECFGEKPNLSNIATDIFDKLEQQWDKVYLKLYQFLKTTANKR